MLKLIKKLLEANVLLIAIAITIFIAFLSIANLGKILPNKDLLISDKLNHAIAYFFMALSWFYAFQKKKLRSLKEMYIVILCILYGILMEFLQWGVTSYRTASYLDVLANSLGVLIAYLGFYFFQKKNQVF